MLFASPSGIALSTPQSVHLSSGQQTNIVNGGGLFIASGKSLIASVAEKISLFVQNAGMKLFSAKGKIEIQAQGAEMDLASQKDLSIKSVGGKVVIAASQEIGLYVGGSYIRITSSGIENGTTGQIHERCASWDVMEADSKQVPHPSFPSGDLANKYLHSL